MSARVVFRPPNSSNPSHIKRSCGASFFGFRNSLVRSRSFKTFGCWGAVSAAEHEPVSGGAEVSGLTYCFVWLCRDKCPSAPVPLRLNLLRRRSSVSRISVDAKTRPIPRYWSVWRCCMSKRMEEFFLQQGLLHHHHKAYKKGKSRLNHCKTSC